MSTRTLRRLHLGTDVVLVTIAWVAAYWTRRALNPLLGIQINPFTDYARSIPLIVLPWLFCSWLFGLYRPRRNTTVEAIQDSLKAATLGFLVVSSVGFFFKEYDFGRIVVALCGGFSLVLQGLSRAGFDRLAQRTRRLGGGIPVLVLGAGTTGIRLIQKLQDDPSGYRVVGFLDDGQATDAEVAGVPVLGPLEQLRQAIQQHQVEQVIVAIPRLDPSRLLSLVVDCEDLGVDYLMVTDVFHALTAQGQPDLVGDMPLVPLRGTRRASIFYEPAKRLLDLLGALLLLALTLPLWLYWALRIRADSRGPVFFSQKRVGRAGKVFSIYKFRTMQADAGPYDQAPRQPDDRRITRYGAWLRRTSIDELPNLLNVVLGQMSLVGPRPEMPFIVEGYEAWQQRRLLVRPGITGLWQILGRKDLPMHENLQYDLFYIHNRSMLLDLSILVRTVASVARRRGAY